MKRKQIITVVGARPQFVKAAVVSTALRESSLFAEQLLHTGQHYDDNMSDVFFRELGIPEPTWHLGIGSSHHGQQTGRMLEEIEKVLLESKPDLVLVYGDTNSTLAGALAAAKLHIPIAHVEAGLRSFNRKMPEEINRVLTDHLSDVLFAPTATAVSNLEREGIPLDGIRLVGDVMYDAVLQVRQRSISSDILASLNLASKPYVLATIHRAENVDDKMQLARIMKVLGRVNQNLRVVFPVHPRTRAVAEKYGLSLEATGVQCIPPVGYLDMLALECSAKCIVTDSGGVQKEAFFCGVPCITLRSETEWVELVELGWNRLLTPDSWEQLPSAVAEASRPDDTSQEKLFGGGMAARRIVQLINEYFENGI